jgi:hypothetical protein
LGLHAKKRGQSPQQRRLEIAKLRRNITTRRTRTAAEGTGTRRGTRRTGRGRTRSGTRRGRRRGKAGGTESVKGIEETSPRRRRRGENFTMGKDNGTQNVLAWNLRTPRGATARVLHNHAKPDRTNGEGGRVFLQHPVPLGKRAASPGEQIPLSFAFLSLCPGKDGSQLRLGQLHHGKHLL